MNREDVLVLAHYYTTKEVQAEADFVGDSLDLAQRAQKTDAKRVVFAGVRFMAETTKMLNPNAEVILPDMGSTCSLVEQTDIRELSDWRERHRDAVHVAYINSSAEHKVLSDVIVTSRNVADVIEYIYELGHKVIFSPDYNMGMYLNQEFGYGMGVWDAVCDVHDKFKADALKEMLDNKFGIVLAHPESPLPVLNMADYVGSTHGMLDYVKSFPYNEGTFYVATEDGLLYNMKQLRPKLEFIQAPTYSGCSCAVCPYMKMNTVQNVRDAIENGTGYVIDYLSEDDIESAKIPVERMLEFNHTGRIESIEDIAYLN